MAEQAKADIFAHHEIDDGMAFAAFGLDVAKPRSGEIRPVQSIAGNKCGPKIERVAANSRRSLLMQVFGAIGSSIADAGGKGAIRSFRFERDLAFAAERIA